MLPKSQLNIIEVLISKALIDSNISHDEFILITNVLKEFYNNYFQNKSKSPGTYKTMLSYCLKCRKNTESKYSKVVRSKNERIMLSSKCAVCESKKLKPIKEKEASGLLTSLGLKTSLNKIPLLGPLLF